MLNRFQDSSEDQSLPPFHFGSHYSNPGVLSYYLVRLQPFSKIAHALQGQKFDISDRLYQKADDNAFNDSKELFPHLFYLPELYLNINNYSLGVTQQKVKVNNVQLSVSTPRA